MSLLPKALVDALPERWWALGNLHFFPGTSKTWHFCVGPGAGAQSVRTIEVFRTRVAWGRRPFDFEASERHGTLLGQREAAQED